MEVIANHIINAIENSLATGGNRIQILISVDKLGDLLEIKIADDRKALVSDSGMNPNKHSYKHTKGQKMELWLASLKQASEICGGTLQVFTQKNYGTSLYSSFKIDHMERQAFGNLGIVIGLIIIKYPNIRFNLKLSSPLHTYNFYSTDFNIRVCSRVLVDFQILEKIAEEINQRVATVFGEFLSEITYTEPKFAGENTNVLTTYREENKWKRKPRKKSKGKDQGKRVELENCFQRCH